MPQRDSRSRAFTLIELLVVVAIIALLIAILLPTIGRAKFRAKVTQCGANMKQMTTGLSVYTAEWNGRLPYEFRGDTATSDYIPRYAWLVQDINSSKTPKPVYGVALLYNPSSSSLGVGGGSNQINDPRVFFCPAQPDIAFSYVRKAYGTDWLATATNDPNPASAANPHMGYMYQIHYTTNTAPHHAESKLSAIPRGYAIISDLIMSDYNIAHRQSASVGIWNLAFPDGHVDAAKSTYATSTLVNGAKNSQNVTTGDWPFFKPILDDLEKVSQN